MSKRNVGDNSKDARPEVVEKTGDGSESAGLRRSLTGLVAKWREREKVRLLDDEELDAMFNELTALAALAPAISRTPTPRNDDRSIQPERGWLIEKMGKDGPEWLHVQDWGGFGWSKDSLKAIRFSRCADGEKVCVMIEDAESVTEHMWEDTSRPPTQGSLDTPRKHDCSQAIARAVLAEAEWWAARWAGEYANETDAHIWELRHAVAIERSQTQPAPERDALRDQFRHCFKQATMAGRFSEEYCIDRIIEVADNWATRNGAIAEGQQSGKLVEKTSRDTEGESSRQPSRTKVDS